MKRFISLLLALFLITGCGQAPDRVDAEREGYTVVATTGMIADLAREVVGDRAEVVALIGEGIDPHLYNPTRSDVAKLLAADVIFYNGLLLEGRMSDVLVQVARQGKPVFAVTELIDPEYLLESDEMEGYADPHVWMDVGAWMQALDVIVRELSRFDPEYAEQYAENAAAFREELRRLDEYAKTAIRSIPESNRILVTAHDAFSYFGRAYGIEVRGIQGISTESEAGLQDIVRLIDMIVERQVGAVFVETSVSDKNVRALVEGAQRRGHQLAIGGSLFSDAMGAAGTYEGTYIGMLDHNITTIARALGGEVPVRGLNDRLQP